MATATYPANVRSFGADVVDFTTTILAEHVNFLRAEVNSVETVLGNLPLTSSGWVGSFDRSTTTWNTVRDRIANIEYGLNTAYNAKVPTGGTQYQVLQKNSSSDYDFSWVTFSGLPAQSSGTNGQFLTSNGSTSSWASISQVPSQSGANCKYLTSDGTTATWGTITQSSGGANEFVLMMMGA